MCLFGLACHTSRRICQWNKTWNTALLDLLLQIEIIQLTHSSLVQFLTWVPACSRAGGHYLGSLDAAWKKQERSSSPRFLCQMQIGRQAPISSRSFDMGNTGCSLNYVRSTSTYLEVAAQPLLAMSVFAQLHLNSDLWALDYVSSVLRTAANFLAEENFLVFIESNTNKAINTVFLVFYTSPRDFLWSVLQNVFLHIQQW